MRILTSRLLGVLADLLQTTHPDSGMGAIGGVLLHSARGHHGAEPGRLELLAGISTDRFTIGHTYAPCSGGLRAPTLWSRRDVRSALTVFKAAREKDKNDVHAVEIHTLDGEVEIREDPNLIDDGVRLTFGELDATDFPARSTYRLLEYTVGGPVIRDGRTIPVAAATHYHGSLLTPFIKIAARRGELIRIYRPHQHRAQLIQIGETYRGVLAANIPAAENYDPDAPDADIYPPDLTDPRWQRTPDTEPSDDAVALDALFTLPTDQDEQTDAGREEPS